jgi:hypothetical protein
VHCAFSAQFGQFADMLEALHQEMGRAHPELQGAEDMFNGAAPLLHFPWARSAVRIWPQGKRAYDVKTSECLVSHPISMNIRFHLLGRRALDLLLSFTKWPSIFGA